MKKTVKQIIKQYRNIKQSIRQSKTIRLTATATATDNYIKIAGTNKYTVIGKNLYYASLKHAEMISADRQRQLDRQTKREQLDRQYKADHFPDNPLTLAECIALKPEKQTAETIAEKIKAISNSIDSLKKEKSETDSPKEKQAIQQKIYHLQAVKAELTFNKSKHKEYDRVDYTWDMLTSDSSGNIITDLCKIITYCSCKKSVTREGTKTQYDMYYACCRAEWDHPDVADVLSVATLATIETLTADAKQLEKDIYFLEKSVDMLKHLNPIIDTAEIQKIVDCCKRHCKDVTNDFKTNRRLSNRKKWMLKAVTEKSVDDLIHSVFLAINNYLISIRSIHVSDTFIVSSIENDYEYYCNIPENETRIDLLFNDSDKKEKRQVILSAYHKVSDIITKSELTTFKYLIKGYTVSQIAYKRKITKQCVSNHLCNIRSAFSRFIVSSPLEYAVIADCIIVDSDSSRQPKTDSEKTAEKKTDRQLETNRIKANMTDGLKDGIKADIIDSLNDLERMIYHSLVNNLTVRQTAETISKSPKYVQTRKAKIQEKIFTVIENECSISINRDLFTNISLYDLVSIFD